MRRDALGEVGASSVGASQGMGGGHVPLISNITATLVFFMISKDFAMRKDRAIALMSLQGFNDRIRSKFT